MRSMLTTAAALAIVTAAGVKWLEVKRLEKTDGPEQVEASTVAEPVKAERPAAAKRASATRTPDTQARRSAQAKPTTAAASRKTTPPPARAVRQPVPSTEPAIAAVSTPATDATRDAPEPSAAPAVAAARSTAPEAPIGRFFEPSDVDEPPQVVTRVEPQLARNGSGGRVSDVVVVRLLVSQSGHPYRVSLLRKSRLGPSQDEAVLAAVNRWTFSPARKRGEAVSCWYNVGVSLGAAD